MNAPADAPLAPLPRCASPSCCATQLSSPAATSRAAGGAGAALIAAADPTLLRLPTAPSTSPSPAVVPVASAESSANARSVAITSAAIQKHSVGRRRRRGPLLPDFITAAGNSGKSFFYFETGSFFANATIYTNARLLLRAPGNGAGRPHLIRDGHRREVLHGSWSNFQVSRVRGLDLARRGPSNLEYSTSLNFNESLCGYLEARDS